MGGGASVATPPVPAAAPVEKRVEFSVSRIVGNDGLPEYMKLVVDKEALVLLSLEADRHVLRSFPYHQIMCWGHTSETFQFKFVTGEDGESPASPTGASRNGEIGDGEDGGGGRAGAGEALADSAPLTGDVVSSRFTVHTIAFAVRRADVVETSIMCAVRILMADMKAKGISTAEFKALLQQMKASPEEAMRSVEQTAMTRSFDVRQATQIVRDMGEVSPFDQVDAAVLMYDHILNRESFHLVLAVFSEPADRDNVCHRLQIALGPSGLVRPIGKARP